MNQTDSALEKIAHGTLLALGGIIISKLLGYTYRLIAARFGTEEYGILSLGLAVFNILTLIGVLGLNQGALRYVSFYREKANFSRLKEIITSAVASSALISILLGALLFIFSDFIATAFFHEPKLGIVLKILAFIVPFDTCKNILFSIIRGFQNVIYEIYSRNITETAVKVFLTLILSFLGYKLLGATIAFSIAILVSFSMAVYYLFKTYNILKHKGSFILFDKELMYYSLPLVLNNFTILVLLWADTLIIGYFKAAHDVGIYNAAGPSAALMYLFPQALLSLFLPVLTGLYAKGNMEDFKNVYKTAIKWVTLVNALAFILFFLSPKELLSLFFGDAYAEGAVVLVILAAGYLIYYLSLISTNVLLIHEKTRLIFFISAAGAALNLVLNVLFIQFYGIIGSALATATAYFFMSLLLFHHSFKLTKIKILFNKNIFKISLAALLSAALTFFFTSFLSLQPALTLLVRSVLASVLYLVMIFLFNVLEEHDFLLLKEASKRLNSPRLERFLNRVVK